MAKEKNIKEKKKKDYYIKENNRSFVLHILPNYFRVFGD